MRPRKPDGGRMRRLPAPALVIACAALFVALVGGAYASGLGGPCGYLVCLNDIGPGQVNARVVRDRSLTATKLSPSLIGALRSQTDFKGVTYVHADGSVPAGSFAKVSVGCPGGKRVIGGGGTTTVTQGPPFIKDTYPSSADGAAGNTGWTVVFGNPGSAAAAVRVDAICA